MPLFAAVSIYWYVYTIIFSTLKEENEFEKLLVGDVEAVTPSPFPLPPPTFPIILHSAVLVSWVTMVEQFNCLLYSFPSFQ